MAARGAFPGPAGERLHKLRFSNGWHGLLEGLMMGIQQRVVERAVVNWKM
jgi:hypothetical protein